MPYLNQVYEKKSNRGLHLIAVACMSFDWLASALKTQENCLIFIVLNQKIVCF